MKAKPLANNPFISEAQALGQGRCLPPIVNNIAIRLAWVTQHSEAEVLAWLSRPFLHDSVTIEDRVLLQARFPFMRQLTSGMTREDFTIMLVVTWARIEALYRQGIVLPAQIMRDLMKKSDNPVST